MFDGRIASIVRIHPAQSDARLAGGAGRVEIGRLASLIIKYVVENVCELMFFESQILFQIKGVKFSKISLWKVGAKQIFGIPSQMFSPGGPPYTSARQWPKCSASLAGIPQNVNPRIDLNIHWGNDEAKNVRLRKRWDCPKSQCTQSHLDLGID